MCRWHQRGSRYLGCRAVALPGRTHADHRPASEACLIHVEEDQVLERHTLLHLEVWSCTPAVILDEIRLQYEQRCCSKKPQSTALSESTDLNPPDDVAPPVFFHKINNHPQMQGYTPGQWLMQPRLKGKALDLVVRNAVRYHNGQYNDRVARVAHMPLFKGGIQHKRPFTMEIIFQDTATIRTFQIQYLKPLTTTEFPSIMSAGFLHRMQDPRNCPGPKHLEMSSATDPCIQNNTIVGGWACKKPQMTKIQVEDMALVEWYMPRDFCHGPSQMDEDENKRRRCQRWWKKVSDTVTLCYEICVVILVVITVYLISGPNIKVTIYGEKQEMGINSKKCR
ncbi:hypothetical protein C8J57DRAFT_1230961 [Mycena rebaudengoi]|nr:hypothetical protein C8J57DRAFT_1230961 [Mycena rebaudengoi]